MSANVDQLDARVTALEKQMAEVVKSRRPDRSTSEPEHAATTMFHQADRIHKELLEGWNKALEEMGIAGEPIGAAKLRDRIAKHLPAGITCEFSQEIIDMREE